MNYFSCGKKNYKYFIKVIALKTHLLFLQCILSILPNLTVKSFLLWIKYQLENKKIKVSFGIWPNSHVLELDNHWFEKDCLLCHINGTNQVLAVGIFLVWKVENDFAANWIILTAFNFIQKNNSLISRRKKTRIKLN